MKMKKIYTNRVLYVKRITAFKDDGSKLEYNIKFYDENSDPKLETNSDNVYKRILSILHKAKNVSNIEEEIIMKGGEDDD